ncbi:hypothetical protein DFH05DRAFT_1461668 [Lentinula detonsa]|uniref:Glutamine amidotransferase type-2 domain-containing protein n=1 Tax=Lentinula detonsa TaxID=2804962 RepID=A0A9W8NX23_9AGAR|nr:hypothetical protein DFH05DRAFT_1461668 [Lentinula detonsa]
MCRWIVYVGDMLPKFSHDNLELLVNAEETLISRVSERFIPGLYFGLEEDDVEELKKQANWINVHGFGVSWYTDTLTEFDPSIKGMLPAQFRTIAPISTDLAFEQLCKHTASKCTLAHIRDASFPPVVEVNNHPFVYGKYSFMHNGTVDSFSKIRYDVMKRIFELQTMVQISQYKSSVQNSNYVFGIAGNTDTEHLAALYFAYIDIIQAIKPSFGAHSTDALLLALFLTIGDIREIQFQHKVGSFTPGPGGERLGNALNLCITAGGVQMLVSRWRDSKKGYPRSLYLSLTAGEKLNRKHYSELPDPTSLEDVYNTDVKIDSDVTSLLVPSRPVQYEQPLSFSSSDRMFSACYVQDWGLLDQNQCVTVDDNRKLRMINLAKFFGPDSERKDMLDEYHFTEVIDKIQTLHPTYSPPPAHDLDLPKSKCDAFQKALHLNAPAK